MILISEALAYLVFLLNIPFTVSLVIMLVAILVVLQDTYGLAPFQFISGLPYIGSRIPREFSFSLDLKGLLVLYARTAFVLFLIWEIVSIGFQLKRASFQRRFLISAILATLGWGFVIAHVPFMKVGAGTTRIGLALFFFFLYLLGIGGFAVGALIERAANAVIDRLLGTSEDTIEA